MQFQVYIPTNYLTVVTVEAATEKEAIESARQGNGEFVQSDFVGFSFDTVEVESA